MPKFCSMSLKTNSSEPLRDRPRPAKKMPDVSNGGRWSRFIRPLVTLNEPVLAFSSKSAGLLPLQLVATANVWNIGSLHLILRIPRGHTSRWTEQFLHYFDEFPALTHFYWHGMIAEGYFVDWALHGPLGYFSPPLLPSSTAGVSSHLLYSLK